MATPSPVWITFSQTNLGEIHMEDPGPGGMRFDSFPDAFDYLHGIAAALQEEKEDLAATGPLPSWTPRSYTLNGSNRERIQVYLISAAAGLARAEKALRDTAPHPRDADFDARQREYAAILRRVEELFEEIQEEAERAERAPGISF